MLCLDQLLDKQYHLMMQKLLLICFPFGETLYISF